MQTVGRRHAACPVSSHLQFGSCLPGFKGSELHVGRLLSRKDAVKLRVQAVEPLVYEVADVDLVSITRA